MRKEKRDKVKEIAGIATHVKEKERKEWGGEIHEMIKQGYHIAGAQIKNGKKENDQE